MTTSILDLYAARVGGRPDGYTAAVTRGCGCGQAQGPVVGTGWNQKDARPCAERNAGYLKSLRADMDRTLVDEETDPATLDAQADVLANGAEGATGFGEDHYLVKDLRARAAHLRKVRTGKDAAKIKAEIAFFDSFKAWKKSQWDPWYYGDTGKTLGGDPVDDATYERCLDFESAILKAPGGWRPRFAALGYAPTGDAPTTAEVDASKPKDPDPANPINSVAGAIGAVAGAIPWVVAGVLGVVAFNSYRGR